MKVTIFKNIFDKANPLYVEVDDVLKYIGNGRWEDRIKTLRETDSKNEQERLKKELPAICFAGEFTERNDNSLTVFSGMIIMDFDHIERPDSLKQLISKSPYVYAAFISPRGNGVKALVRVDENQFDRYAEYFKAISDYFSRKVDKSGKNISRACYVSYDKDIYINHKALEFPLGQAVPKIPLEDKTYYSKIIDWLSETTSATANYVEGNRNNYIFELSCLCSEYGIPQDISVSRLSSIYACDDFSIQEIENTVKSAYHKTSKTFNTKRYWDTAIYTEAKALLKKRRKVQDVANDITTKHKSLSYGDVVEMCEYIKEYDLKYFNTFWTIEVAKSGDRKIKISRSDFIDFIENKGFYFYDDDIVQITNNIVDVFPKRTQQIKSIQNYVREYLESLPERADNFDRRELIEQVLRQSEGLFSDKFINFLKVLKLKRHRSTDKVTYFYFQNQILKITADNIETVDYIFADGLVFKDNIIPYDVSIEKDYKGEFFQFVYNISDKDDKRMLYTMSVIGYLLQGYKPRSEEYAVICMDEDLSSGTPEGGTGKGIFTYALSKIRNVESQDGKSFDPQSQFGFQSVKPFTDLLLIQDVKKGFNFENLFSAITDGLNVQRKFMNPFFMPYEESPFFVITSNYDLKGDSTSHERRRLEVEFAKHYNKNFTPIDEFGHRLFWDWDKKEWSKFFMFMAKCVQVYKKEGILFQLQNRDNINRNKFKSNTSRDFVEWWDMNCDSFNRVFDLSSAKDEFVRIYDYKNLTFSKFRSWFELALKYTGIKGYIKRQKNFIFIPEGIDTPQKKDKQTSITVGETMPVSELFNDDEPIVDEAIF